MHLSFHQNTDTSTKTWRLRHSYLTPDAREIFATMLISLNTQTGKPSVRIVCGTQGLNPNLQKCAQGIPEIELAPATVDKLKTLLDQATTEELTSLNESEEGSVYDSLWKLVMKEGFIQAAPQLPDTSNATPTAPALDTELVSGASLTLGELMATNQAIRSLYNLPPHEFCTQEKINKLREEILKIKDIFATQIKAGMLPSFTISSRSNNAMFFGLSLENWRIDKLLPTVRYYPLWKELDDWACSQHLTLHFKAETSPGTSNGLTITATPDSATSIETKDTQVLFQLHKLGQNIRI